MKVFLLASLILAVIALARLSQADAAAVASGKSVYDFKVKTIDGEDKSLADYKGQVILIVNTASRCGFTHQYAGLEELYERYKAKGFVILAFPSNDFMGQEPGDNSEIKKFCALKFKTSFPLFSKIKVKGAAMEPLYQYLTTGSGFNGDISWNFNKFLVDRQGQVIARFGSTTEPLDPSLENKLVKVLSD